MYCFLGITDGRWIMAALVVFLDGFSNSLRDPFFVTSLLWPKLVIVLLYVSVSILLLTQVAGNFTYGVMALSAATYMFWSILGSQLVPAAIQHGGAMSLALQLSCSVLV
jgi:hypothetical protein